jgi:hypothetical protein
MSMAGPLRGAGDVDPRASIFNVKKTSIANPLGGAGARDLEAFTINAKKHRRQAP